MSTLDSQVKRHFDEISDHYYGIVGDTPFLYGYYHSKELSFLAKVLRNYHVENDVHGDEVRILDIGCATGRVLRHVSRLAPDARLFGLDLSPRMAKAAGKTMNRKIESIVGDIRNLPFRDEAFNFVYSLEVIEHLPDKPSSVLLALGEMVRVSKKRCYSVVESTSAGHFIVQSLIRRALPKLRASVLQEEKLQRYSELYLKTPLPVADPSSVSLISRAISSQGATIRGVFWIRVIPEQAFVILKSVQLRKFLAVFDELLVRVPLLRRLGREFIIYSQRLT